METQDLLNSKVGTKELPKLEAKDIEVLGVKVEEKGEKKNQIFVLMCKHPDKEDTLEMTKIKVLRNDKTKVVGLWVQKDADGNIQKGSAMDDVLKLAGVETPSELTGKVFSTVYQAEEGSFICLKGY